MSSNVQGDLASVIADAVKSSVGVTFNSIFGEPPVSVASEGPTESCARVASVISFFGTSPWALTLVLPEETAVKMALKFTGFEVPFDCADMGDVVGELTNVLAGEVVAQLNRRSIQSQMSLPMVARGNDVELLKPTGAPASHLGYQSAQGHFWFEICTASTVQRLCRKPGTAA
ncbi:MAG: chemotaxis protein CheX [Planctomycetales bacterium]|nr:chemotaxis protein CheX [Planctomycetales bacterium]